MSFCFQQEIKGFSVGFGVNVLMFLFFCGAGCSATEDAASKDSCDGHWDGGEAPVHHDTS